MTVDIENREGGTTMVTRKGFIAILLTVLLILCSCTVQQQVIAPMNEGEMRVHFLDVGQGDSMLIQLPNGKSMLIDGGTRENGGNVVNYIKSAGIKKLDYIIATHPHEDHIGGLIKVVEKIPVEKIYMPKVSHTTKTFRQFVEAVISNGNKFYRAKTGVSIYNDKVLRIDILAPVEDNYEKLNNYSAVVKIEYKTVKMLFMGDAEHESEMQIDISGLPAQVLKVGHHGSSSATSPEFLSEVNPVYAVISAGKNNDYGHPHRETLQLLKSKGIEILRTDEMGTIIMTTDGKSIVVHKNN